MAGTIYRSVKIVLQNSTNEALSVQGVAVLTGRWGEKMEPTQGTLVAEQSAAEWMSVSTELGQGTSAFVRLGSSRGYLTVQWNLPWTGRFQTAVNDLPGLSHDVVVDEAHPDSVVVLVAIGEKPRQGNGNGDCGGTGAAVSGAVENGAGGKKGDK